MKAKAGGARQGKATAKNSKFQLSNGFQVLCNPQAVVKHNCGHVLIPRPEVTWGKGWSWIHLLTGGFYSFSFYSENYNINVLIK